MKGKKLKVYNKTHKEHKQSNTVIPFLNLGLYEISFQANSTTPCTTIQSEWESNPDIERCNEYDWVLIVIAALYLLISNLLLVNLVIALFR